VGIDMAAHGTPLTSPQPGPTFAGRSATSTVAGAGDRAADSEFADLYDARYGDVLAMAYALTADFAEAQDIAQEAFCRAWQRWPSIHERDEPIAWVKRVAANLAISRGRRLQIARRLRFHHRPAVAPPISVDHVTLVAELRRLPANMTRALVLHYIADLSVEEIADTLGTQVGTVKSWLHRGRHALAQRLAEPATPQEGGAP